MVAARYMYKPWRCFDKPPEPKKRKVKAAPGNEKRRRLRHRLFREQHGRCHFCCEPMIEYQGAGERWPDNAAVLYHMRDRLDPRRGEPTSKPASVACCRACAQEQSDQRQENHPIELLWQRSGSYPSQVYEIANAASNPEDLNEA